MKKMLINATQREELRVALVEEKRLYDLDIESIGFEQTKANIYKGRIAKLAPSLDAVFVDYGEEKHGFLPLKEIAPSALLGLSTETLAAAGGKIKSLIKEGEEILVQINKSERGTKGAALTTYVSLAGSYLVLMPNNSKAAGISRRIEGAERQALKQELSQLQVPTGMGVIVRTAGICKTYEDLAWDLKSLLNYWEAICAMAVQHPAPCLIHQEGSILSRAIRDHVRRDIDEIWVDDPTTYALVKEKIALFKPEFLSKVYLHSGSTPLFHMYQIEPQIETAFQREVKLPSGGSIVIDSTEALTAIDVNSARSTKGLNIEETAYLTNLEAAQEICRQFRLRDLGGLVVIDFIDMQQAKHQQILETRMREFVKEDRARVQIGTLSRFGLLELSRQRLGFSLRESTTHTCPRCYGRGTVRSNESLALVILRLLEDAAMQPSTENLCALVPIEIGSYLLNEKRLSLIAIERKANLKIFVVPVERLQTPNYSIHHLPRAAVSDHLSYQLSASLEKNGLKTAGGPEVVSSMDIVHAKPHRALLSSPGNGRLCKAESNSKLGILNRIIGWFLPSKKLNAASSELSEASGELQTNGFPSNVRTSTRKQSPDPASDWAEDQKQESAVSRSTKNNAHRGNLQRRGHTQEVKTALKRSREEARQASASQIKETAEPAALREKLQSPAVKVGSQLKEPTILSENSMRSSPPDTSISRGSAPDPVRTSKVSKEPRAFVDHTQAVSEGLSEVESLAEPKQLLSAPKIAEHSKLRAFKAERGVAKAERGVADKEKAFQSTSPDAAVPSHLHSERVKSFEEEIGLKPPKKIASSPSMAPKAQKQNFPTERILACSETGEPASTEIIGLGSSEGVSISKTKKVIIASSKACQALTGETIPSRSFQSAAIAQINEKEASGILSHKKEERVTKAESAAAVPLPAG